jgi:hypothetical protein
LKEIRRKWENNNEGILMLKKEVNKLEYIFHRLKLLKK